MSVPIHGQPPKPINPLQGPHAAPEPPEHKEAGTVIQQAIDAMVEASRSFDNEVQGLAGARLNKSEVKQNALTRAQDEPGRASLVFADAIVAAENVDETDSKKKKKKKDWEAQLDKLAKLDGALNENEVAPEDRGIIKKFFDNMAEIKRLRRELRQVQEQKEAYKRILDSNDKSQSRRSSS